MLNCLTSCLPDSFSLERAILTPHYKRKRFLQPLCYQPLMGRSKANECLCKMSWKTWAEALQDKFRCHHCILTATWSHIFVHSSSSTLYTCCIVDGEQCLFQTRKTSQIKNIFSPTLLWLLDSILRSGLPREPSSVLSSGGLTLLWHIT